MPRNDKYDWLKKFCKQKKFSARGTKLMLTLARSRDKQVDWLKLDEHLAKEQFLVELLMKEGVYPKKPTPAMKEQGYTPFDMYEGWGVLWAFYDEPLKCPHCKKSLKDVKNGPPFKLEIGIYDTTRDITTHFECPDCHGIIGKYYHE